MEVRAAGESGGAREPGSAGPCTVGPAGGRPLCQRAAGGAPRVSTRGVILPGGGGSPLGSMTDQGPKPVALNSGKPPCRRPQKRNRTKAVMKAARKKRRAGRAPGASRRPRTAASAQTV